MSKEDKLLGKWKISFIHTKMTENGKDILDSYYKGKSDDYISFSINNKAYEQTEGRKRIIRYFVMGNNRIIINKDTFLINILKNKLCVLKYKKGSSKNFTEKTMQLVK